MARLDVAVSWCRISWHVLVQKEKKPFVYIDAIFIIITLVIFIVQGRWLVFTFRMLDAGVHDTLNHLYIGVQDTMISS